MGSEFEYFEISDNRNKPFAQRPFILTLKNGSTLDHQILDGDSNPIVFEPPIYDGIANKYYISKNDNKSPVVKLPGTAYTFIKVYANNYAHWVHDILPAFRLFDYHKKQIHIPYFHNFQREYLELLKINPNNIIHYPDKRSIKADNLKFVYSGTRYEGITEFLRNTFCSGTKKRSRIYISRNDVNHRRVANEVDLFSHLSPLGFKSYLLSKIPVVQQIKRFEEAEVVVIPHGAGSANLFYCRPGTQVIQFWPEKLLRSSGIYPKDLVYHDLIEQVSNKDMVVDIERAMKTIRGCCELS